MSQKGWVFQRLVRSSAHRIRRPGTISVSWERMRTILLYRFAACVMLLPSAAQPLGAQQLAATALGTPAQVAPASTARRSFLGALAGGAAGALVGGVAGAWIGGNRCVDAGNPDSCYLLLGTVTGLAVGMTIGTPLGAHLLNRRRGDLRTGLLASTAIAGAGLVAFRAADINVRGSARPATLNAILVAVPVLQVATATVIEGRTGARR